jgi:hypothetical protein
VRFATGLTNDGGGASLVLGADDGAVPLPEVVELMVLVALD